MKIPEKIYKAGRILALSLCMTLLPANSFAQEETVEPEQGVVMFELITSKGDLSVENAKLLHSKAERLLSRNQALADGSGSPFVIIAEVIPGESLNSEGLVRNVGSVNGELVLKAMNRFSNALYYSATTPLTAAGTGNEEALQKALINSIKVNDAAYVRFVRNARKAIADYFTTNCRQALDEALALALADDFDRALAIARSIPPSAPCFDEALEMITKFKPQPVPVPETQPVPAPAPAPTPGPAVTPAPKPEPAPVPKPEPEVAPAPKPSSQETRNPEIYVSDQACTIKSVEATYVPANHSVNISVIAVFNPGSEYDVNVRLSEAIDTEGASHKDYIMVDNQNYRRFPTGVPVKMTFGATGFPSNPGEFLFVKIKLGGVNVEIRNLKIK